MPMPKRLILAGIAPDGAYYPKFSHLTEAVGQLGVAKSFCEVQQVPAPWIAGKVVQVF